MSISRRRIGVGVVSLGWMGRLHTRAYRRIGEHYPELGVDTVLVAAADPLPRARQEAVDVLGFQHATADYREVLADPEVDVVSVCAPNFLHHEIAMAAVGAGKPFWIEKPMGVNAAQAREIATAARAAGLVTAVGFNYRNAPGVAFARELLRTGRLGRLTNLRVWFIADYASDPRGALTWRYNREQAGAGVVGDLMSHGIDLAQFLAGPIEQVTALTDTFIPARPLPLEPGIGNAKVAVSDDTGSVENEDYVGLLARFASGTVATMEASRTAIGPRAEYVVQVYGTRGSLRWDFADMSKFEVCLSSGSDTHGYTTVMAGAEHGEYGRFQPGPGQNLGFDDLKTIEGKAFLESVLTGTQRAASAADAWSAAEVDEAVVASAADGTWHAVTPVDGITR